MIIAAYVDLRTVDFWLTRVGILSPWQQSKPSLILLPMPSLTLFMLGFSASFSSSFIIIIIIIIMILIIVILFRLLLIVVVVIRLLIIILFYSFSLFFFIILFYYSLLLLLFFFFILLFLGSGGYGEETLPHNSHAHYGDVSLIMLALMGKCV